MADQVPALLSSQYLHHRKVIIMSNERIAAARGFAPERLQTLDSTLQRYIDQGLRTGFNAMVLRKGDVVFQRSYGYRDRATRAPMQMDSLFRVFSMTKIVTAVAALMLWEEGKFQLNDPISQYLPEFGDLQVMTNVTETDFDLEPAERPIIIRDLFLHTAGLAYVFPYHPKLDEQVFRLDIGLQRPEGGQASEPTLAQYVVKVAQLPLVAQPGQSWHYSFAIDVLARLVEVIAERPWPEVLRRRILQPLGMEDTSFVVPEDRRNRLTTLAATAELFPPEMFAQLHTDEHGIGHFPDPTADVFVHPQVQPRGGHGLISTITDYAVFLQCLLNNGEYKGHRLLGRKTVEFARANHLSPEQLPFEVLEKVAVNARSRGFGFLGEVALDPVQKGWTLGSAGEFSWSGFAGTWFSVDPVEKMILLLFTQYISDQDREGIWHEFRNGTYQALVD